MSESIEILKKLKSNNVLNYDEVLSACDEIVKSSKSKKFEVKEEQNMGITATGIPIKHYTIGNGKKHIVVSGAVHGSEIITTDFVVNLMNSISCGEDKFLFMENGEYTLDFIPVLNPEGYIVTTSAIEKVQKEYEDREVFYDKYFWAYRLDDQIQMSINANKRDIVKLSVIPEEYDDLKAKAKDFSERADGSVKLHQEMFKDATWEDIPDKYYDLKMKIKELYETYGYPLGYMIDWSANGEGIDINANSIFNPITERIENGEEIYKTLRHSNIKISDPGPINCPFDKTKGFDITKENSALQKFFKSLDDKKQLFGYFNYHGTGAEIYQRPSEIPEEYEKRNIDLNKKSLRNYLIARLYQDRTYKMANDRKSKYSIKIGKNNIETSNDSLRLLYPADILVELSGRGGNPIAPYYSLNGNYNAVINSNMDGFANAVEALDLANTIADAANDVINKFQENSDSTEDYMLKKYEILEMIYSEFSRKIDQMRGNKEKDNDDSKEL